MSLLSDAGDVAAALPTGGLSLLGLGGGGSFNPSQLPVVGNLGKSLGLWSDPNEAAYRKALADAAQQIQNYRPMEAQARMNALGNQLSLMGPYNQALSSVYGPQYQFDTSKLMQNPMPAGMTSSGAPGAKPGGQIQMLLRGQ